MVKEVFHHLVKNGVPEQKLESLTLQDGAQISDWDNPWGAVNGPGRVFQATRKKNGGQHEPEINAKQLRGPPALDPCCAYDFLNHQQRFCPTAPNPTVPQDSSTQQGEAERQTKAYLDTMPPAILREMIEANSSQLRGTGTATEDLAYGGQTGCCSRKEEEYEEMWRESSGILPILQWQLRKRKEQGWRLWDMPLMQIEAGKEGFLYDGMMKAEVEGEGKEVDLTRCMR